MEKQSFYLPKLDEYPELAAHLNDVQARDFEQWVAEMRLWCEHDLYFLMRYVVSFKDALGPDGVPMVEHPFVFEFVREVQRQPYEKIHIAARGHCKSVTKTLCLPIQEMIKDRNITMLIVSHKADMAEDFAVRLADEVARNRLLKTVFPDHFWDKPSAEAPRWSARRGYEIKRPGSRNEPTFASASLGSSQASKHYDIILLDDPWEKDAARSPVVRESVDQAWNQLIFCVSRNARFAFTGTFYSDSDKFCELRDAGMPVDVRPAVDCSKPAPEGYEHLGGKPVFMTAEELDKIYRKSKTDYWVQMVCDPRGASMTTWDADLIKYYHRSPEEEAGGKNIYITVDPGGMNYDSGDPTAILVWGLGADGNEYLLDISYDRMSSTKRISEVIRLHRLWSDDHNVIEARWEENGQSSDVEHLEAAMEREGYRFRVISVARPGAVGESKIDRTHTRLDPVIRNGRAFFPAPGLLKRKRISSRGEAEWYDAAEDFRLEEVARFPASYRDDRLDSWCLLHEPPNRKSGNKKVNKLIYPGPNDDGVGRRRHPLRRRSTPIEIAMVYGEAN